MKCSTLAESVAAYLVVDRQKVKDSPAYDAFTTVDGASEDHFYNCDIRPGNRS